jgi:L-rhamnose mutarotase
MPKILLNAHLIKAIIIFSIASMLTGCCTQTLDVEEEGIVSGRRITGIIKVRPEYEERYIILHKHTFPGVLSRIRASNIRNYSIFLKDRILFSHFEYIGSNYKADMDAIADPTTKEWWKLTDPMQEPLECRKEGEWWASMEEWLYTGEKTKPSPQAQRYAYTAPLPAEQANAYKEKLNAFKPGDLKSFSDTGIQNLSIHYLDGGVYVYFEYTGTDLPDAVKRLFQHPAMANDTLKWEGMREVFHTN